MVRRNAIIRNFGKSTRFVTFGAESTCFREKTDTQSTKRQKQGNQIFKAFIIAARWARNPASGMLRMRKIENAFINAIDDWTVLFCTFSFDGSKFKKKKCTRV